MFTSFCDIFSTREKQLELQEKHDYIIEKKGILCPQLFLKLFLLERKLNREQLQNNKKTTNIFSIIKNTQNNMDNIDKYQLELDKVLASKFLCNDLEKFINKHR